MAEFKRETMSKMHKMVLDDLRLKVIELADNVGIAKSTVHRTLTEYLDIKSCALESFNSVFGDSSQL